MTNFDQRSFDQAVSWFVALQDEHCPPKTRDRFQLWLDSDASHTEAYVAAENLWSNLDNLKQLDLPELDDARQASHSGRRLARGSVVGLLLASAFAVGWQDYQAPLMEVTTGIGERRSVELADGSRVELNAMSRMSAKVSWLRREVHLYDGEAMFEVEHRVFPAFSVAAANLEIQDLGTRFNVHLMPDETRISVLEGEVAVKADDSWLAESLKAGFGRRILKSGRWQPIEPLDFERTSAWIGGRLVFEHTPLAEVVYELQRYHDLSVVFADPALANETLSGGFNASDLKPFLNAMEKILPVKVRREGDQVILSRRH
jgi:transmembrane sensor